MPSGIELGRGEGYWRVWLNDTNQWIYPHLRIAQTRMTELVERFSGVEGVRERAVKQAGRELLLAQSSDWPFILRTGTSPEYATTRVKEHLQRFLTLYTQLTTKKIDEPWLDQVEKRTIFSQISTIGTGGMRSGDPACEGKIRLRFFFREKCGFDMIVTFLFLPT